MSDSPLTEPPTERLSISERAAKRERIVNSGRDRYGSLCAPCRPATSPVGTAKATASRCTRSSASSSWRSSSSSSLVRLARGVTVWRDNTTDTWSGPDRSVQSGQRLDGCPPVNILHDDAFPTWIRFQGAIFALANSRRPVAAVTAENGWVATGYENDSRQLLRVLDTDGVMQDDELPVFIRAPARRDVPPRTGCG
jgi:hypothetical protein